MINQNDYFIELDFLSYDIKHINELANSLHNHWKEFSHPITGKLLGYHEIRHDEITAQANIEDIIKSLDLDFRTPAFFTRLPPNFHLPAHIDPTRNAVLIFPMELDDSAPIYWEENNQIILSHTYRFPTLVNVKKMHGVKNNNKFRNNLQITLNNTWEEILLKKLNQFKKSFNILITM